MCDNHKVIPSQEIGLNFVRMFSFVKKKIVRKRILNIANRSITSKFLSENENAQRRNIENRAFARRDRTKKILDTIKKRKSLIKQKKRLKCDGCHKKKPPLKCKNFSCSNKSEKCDFHKLQLCNRSRVPYQNLFNLNQLYSRPMNNCIYENTVNTFINTVHSFVRDGRNDGPHGMVSLFNFNYL